jgi:peptidyl-dipeptidase Dcp
MSKSNILILAAMVMLAVGCKQKSSEIAMNNPFFADYDTPFGVPAFDKISFEHFKPAFEEGMKVQKSEIEAIATSKEAPDFKNTVEALDNSGEMLYRVSRVFFNFLSANTSDSLQEMAKEISPVLSKHSDDINLDPKLFARIKTVYESRDALKLNPEQKKLTEEIYLDFVRGGANLKPDQQARFREINERLSLLGLQFGDNVLAENNAFQLIIDKKEDLAGLPQGVIDAAADAAGANKMEGKWLFTLDKPSLIPFLQYAENRQLREKIYRGYFMRGNNGNAYDNNEIISEIVGLRNEKAILLGYKNHADFVLDRNMSKTSENVYNLLNQLWSAALPNAKKELELMQAIAKKEGKTYPLESWDWWYYSEKLRKEKFNLDEEMIRPYLKLENVRDGIFDLSNKLYGITFSERTDLPVYHEEVVCYEVKEKDGTHLGILYMDYHPRASKRGGAWCTSYRSQYRKGNKMINPVVSIVCNFTRPTGDMPALLNLDETETFFHEFGHALHALLSNGTYKRIGGTAVPRDFVELPSQIMEHWVTETQMLKLYARHYETNEPMPDDLILKIQNSSLFNQGFATVEYLAAAILDMDFHTSVLSEKINAASFEKNSMKKIGLISEIIPRYRSTYFSHIFAGGYSAGYYSYIWSEVLDSDAFEKFKESGNIFDPATALSFRENILSKGGSDDPLKLYTNFRGREPKIDALLKNRGLN